MFSELTIEELEIAAHALELTVSRSPLWPKEDKAEYRALARRFNAEVKVRRASSAGSVVEDEVEASGSGAARREGR